MLAVTCQSKNHNECFDGDDLLSKTALLPDGRRICMGCYVDLGAPKPRPASVWMSREALLASMAGFGVKAPSL